MRRKTMTEISEKTKCRISREDGIEVVPGDGVVTLRLGTLEQPMGPDEALRLADAVNDVSWGAGSASGRGWQLWARTTPKRLDMVLDADKKWTVSLELGSENAFKEALRIAARRALGAKGRWERPTSSNTKTGTRRA